MLEFWYDYVKTKYIEKANLCYIDTDSFTVYIETENIHVGIAKDVEARFHTLSYELKVPLPRGLTLIWVGESSIFAKNFNFMQEKC